MSAAGAESRRDAKLVAVAAVLLSIGLPSVARPADHAGAFVFPPASGPLGRAYGELAAQWWQWALSAPGALSAPSAYPLVDTSGDACAVGQRDVIWFLAGTSVNFGGPATVTRSCTMPAGRILVFPVVNAAYFAFLDDPPGQRTAAYVRSQVRSVEHATGLFAEIDGVPVRDVAHYLEKSSLFTVVLPAGNILESWGLGLNVVLSPSVDEGYYLAVVLAPPPPGSPAAKHTLHFGAANDGQGHKVDATYHITVLPP